VEVAFKSAYESKCKGITVYRDTSKEEQVLNKIRKLDEDVEKAEKVLSRAAEIHAKMDRLLEHSGVGASSRAERERREGKLDGSTYKVHTGDGTLYLTINANGDGLPFETFATIGKAGSDVIAFTDAISRLISLVLQYKIPVDQITKQLIGISGAKPVFHTIGNHHRILSIPDAIGKVLDTHMEQLSLVQPSALDLVVGPLRGVIASEVQRDLFQLDPLPKVVNITYSSDICNKCGQEFRVVRNCKTCGCGSTCE
jgi:ribonucleoside-diphosphate reductase alpha chain